MGMERWNYKQVGVRNPREMVTGVALERVWEKSFLLRGQLVQRLTFEEQQKVLEARQDGLSEGEQSGRSGQREKCKGNNPEQLVDTELCGL